MSDEDELSEDELSAMESRCAAATAGPWTSWIEGRNHASGDSVITTAAQDIYISSPQNHQQSCDQDFIAAARQDVPRLIAEVRRLRGVLENEQRR